MRDRKEFVLTAKAKIRKRNGKLKKWKPTTLNLGTRAEKLLLKIAKCFARSITEQNLGYEITLWTEKIF